jgi:hypothetical protein
MLNLFALKIAQVFFVMAKLFFWVVFCCVPIYFVRNWLSGKRDQWERKKQTKEAIARLEKKPRIILKPLKRPKKYRSQNWGAKWVAYSNGIPCNPRRYQMSVKQHPNIPRVNER